MKRYLVTGGAGFVGSHLCEKLLNLGHEVLCLDDLSTGALQNIAPWISSSRFTFREADVCSSLDVEVDGIYNLASPASPRHYQADPVRTLWTNVQGTRQMLELAKKLNVPLLQASTSEVYGDPLCHPQVESYWGHVNPIGIRSCYDEGKRCAETLCFDYQRMYGVPVKVARIFNTYGPRMSWDDGRVVSNFIIQAILGQPLTVYGQGEQTRSFCYVEDLVRGLILLMGSGGEVTSPVNLGNPHEFKVRELAEMVSQQVGIAVNQKFEALPEDDPKQRCPDITLAKQWLGWEPKIELAEGLAKTIAYFQEKKGVFAELAKTPLNQH